MTLDDAFRGLLQYWTARPDGGTRVELLQLAVAGGFEEPLLAEWLDVFLQGFVDTGFLPAADYDAQLAPRVAQVGVATASRAARAVFLHLTEQGGDLDVVRQENSATRLTAQIAALTAQRALVQQGRDRAATDFPAGGMRVATLAALDFALGLQQSQIGGMIQARDELLEEISSLESQLAVGESK